MPYNIEVNPERAGPPWRVKARGAQGSASWGKPKRSWQRAVVRYLELKIPLRSIKALQRICRMLDSYLRDKLLTGINGDLIWSISQRELAKCNKPATVNRYLATMPRHPAHGRR